MSDSTTSVLIVGVGGQGTILAADIQARVVAAAGMDVTIAEVHGMAQRGGSVHSMVRFGGHVHSPLIARGDSDVLLAFELMEGVRWLPYLAPGGEIIVSTQRIAPIGVVIGDEAYPEDLETTLASTGAATLVDAVSLARDAGSLRATNSVMLGVLSTRLALPVTLWEDVISARVPMGTAEVNLRAFAHGRERHPTMHARRPTE